MCLYSITQASKSKSDCGYGWKVFLLVDGYRLRLPHQGTNTLIPTEVWIDEKDWRLERDPPVIRAEKYGLLHLHNFKGISTYLSGWHIFQSLTKARLWASECTRVLPNNKSKYVIHKVIYQSVRARGMQEVTLHGGERAKIIVSQLMYVCNERREGKDDRI